MRDGLPCGECRSCRFLAAGSHPDFFDLQPEEPGKPIKIDAVRKFVGWSVLTPQEGTRRLALIAPADAMNAAAANSLLKTLEEPAPSIGILLVTSRMASLPATVRSRCQRFTLEPPPRAEALSWLETRGVQESAAGHDWRLLLELARGAPLRALALAKGDALGARKARLAELENLLLGRVDAVDIAAAWVAGDLAGSLAVVTSWLRDMARLRVAGSGVSLENADLAATLQRLSETLDLTKVLRVQEAAETGARDWQRGNLNLQMQTEDLLLALLETRR